jgi:RecA-family ATPase
MDDLRLIKMSGVRSETVKMLWNPYIPLGKITILQGDPSCGKTTVALVIAAAVTRGENIAEDGNDAALPPSNVIFQTAEDGLADTVKPRLEQFGADCDRVLVIDESDKALSLSDECIEAAIVSVGAVLAVIDPVQAYCNGSDFHSVNGMRPLMKHLAGVAEYTGAAILIIGHLNKKGGKSAYRGLGSIDIYAAARSVLTVGKLPFDDTMRGLVPESATVDASSRFRNAQNPLSVNRGAYETDLPLHGWSLSARVCIRAVLLCGC